jgi:sugar diacid utilization regulator
MFRVEALRAVAQRIAVQTDELAHTIVRRVRTGVVNPGLIEGEPEFDAMVRFSSANIDALLSGLTGEEPVPESLLQDTRQMGRQLVSNGVSLSAMHHAGRVWGAAMWEAVLAASSADDPEEREAALEIGTRIWHHVDVISTTAALAYLDEVNDRGLVGRELMDTLLGGRGETEFATRLAHSLHLRLGEQHVVVLVRGDDVPIEDASVRPLATRVALDYIVEAVRNHLHPTAGSLLVGIRLGDVVAIYPVSEQDDLRLVRRDCEALARALSIDVSLGMSGWHAGLAGIEVAYAEAREAVEIAAGTGIRGRAVALEEVIVDHMLRSSPHAQRILDAALRPLFEYDRLHHAELVETLRAYLAADTNLTKTARLVTVHPNTIVYRLRRIQELTGRDPRVMEELLVLSLALKLTELRSPSYASDPGEAPTAEAGS